jgi:hypothetical protein
LYKAGVFVQETKNVNTYEFILKKTNNGLKGVKSGQTVLERETKHSTVLERFWNRKKEYLRVLEKKTHIFDQIFTSLYDC